MKILGSLLMACFLTAVSNAELRTWTAVNGKQVLESATITLTNRYEYNATEVLGKAEEYEVLSASQAKDIARQILVQISTL